MYELKLNDMRHPKYEMLTTAATAETKQELIEMVLTERVETYWDGKWAKNFKKDGPLEWFNLPLSHQQHIFKKENDHVRS
jgi:hypothetical protein